MKNHLVLLVFLICFVQLYGNSQIYADKEYYLIDSLNLEELTDSDVQLLDSALNLYHNTPSDTNQLKALSILQENMMHKDWSKYNLLVKQRAEQKLTTIIKESSIFFYQKILGDALNNMGFIYQSDGDNSKALECHLKALEIYKKIKHQPGIASVFINVGFIYENEGNISKALRYYYNSLENYEKSGDKKGAAEALNNIASICKDRGDFPRAIKYYFKNLKFHQKTGNKQGVAIASSSLGEVFHKHYENIPKALKYYHLALDIAKEVGNKTGEAILLERVGSAHYSHGELDAALSYYKKALVIHEKNGGLRGVAHSNITIGEVYIVQEEKNLVTCCVLSL